MKRTLIFIISLIFLIQLVSAAEVCVIADYGNNEPDSKCISIEEGKNGYDVLEATGFDILWSPKSMWGQMVCKINNVGTDVKDASCYYDPDKQEFWNFVLKDGTEWGHSPIGLNGGDECWNRDFSWSDWSKVVHYCAKEGDVLGFAFGKAGSEPDMFKINISKVYVDGEKETKITSSGGKIRNVFPESSVEFKIDLESLYDSDTGIDISDISIKGTIEEINDGGDIEEEIEEFDLESDKKTTKGLKFKIPLEVEAKDRLLRIEINAEDDAGIKYEKEFRYDLEIEKEEHKLEIIKAELDKDSYKCGENTLLSFSIINIGAKDENVNLRIVNEDLRVDINENFGLSNNAFEESSKYGNRFNIYLPNNISATTYPITITVEYGSEKEIKNINLVVSECEKKEVTKKTEEAKESEEFIEIQAEQEAQKEEIEVGKEKEPKEITVTDEKIGKNLFIFLTVVLAIFVVIIIVLFVMFWVVKR